MIRHKNSPFLLFCGDLIIKEIEDLCLIFLKAKGSTPYLPPQVKCRTFFVFIMSRIYLIRTLLLEKL